MVAGRASGRAGEGGTEAEVLGPAAPAGVLALAGSGAVFGAVTSAVNHGWGPYPGYTSQVVGNDWAWLLACLVAGLAGRTWTAATARGLVFTACAVLSYYAADSAGGTYASSRGGGSAVEVSQVAADAGAYLIVSVMVAAAAGLLVSRSAGAARSGCSP